MITLDILIFIIICAFLFFIGFAIRPGVDSFLDKDKKVHYSAAARAC